MLVKAAIFDLDGTIASFNLDYRKVRTLVKDYLSNKGVPLPLLSLDESVFEMLQKTEIWARNSGKSPESIEEIRNEALATTESYELQAASTTELLPGVVDSLKTLKAMGLKIGLCTINSEKSVNNILERFGIADTFEAVITRNHVRHVKPDPEHLKAALRVLGTLPSETLVVGDSRIDMQSAKRLGAFAVGLPTGVSTVDQLMAGGADCIITSMNDLKRLVFRLKKAHGKARLE